MPSRKGSGFLGRTPSAYTHPKKHPKTMSNQPPPPKPHDPPQTKDGGGLNVATCSGLADDLDALVIQMRNVAARMEYYGGFNSEICEHARELVGAANIARTWAKRIRAGKTAKNRSGSMYRCSACRRPYWRDSSKAWIKSICVKTGKDARLIRVPNSQINPK